MAKAHESWRVLPHDPIEKVAENLWRVEGALENMPLKRVMTLVRMTDGRLVVHNAMALDEASMREIEAWGAPSFLIVPNGYHRLDAKAFKARYPAIKVLCPAGARKKVEQVVAVDGTVNDLPPDETVRCEHPAGVGEAEAVMIVRSADGTTLVFTDLVFNMPHLPGVQGFVLRYVTGSSGGPRVSRLGKMFIVKDKRAFARELERLAGTAGLRRVIVGHHELIREGAAETLLRVASTLR